MSSYYTSDASRNSSTSRNMWSLAGVNSDSGSDSDFSRGKKRKPADNLLERIQKRLQSENFYDLNTSDEATAPSLGRSGQTSSSSHYRSQPQGYASQDASSMMRAQSGIVVPQAPSPPIISMQEELSGQALGVTGRAGYTSQQGYKSDPRSRDPGSRSFSYQSSAAVNQAAATRFGPPTKKSKTEMDLGGMGQSGDAPCLSEFLAKNFGVSQGKQTTSYGRAQRSATSEDADADQPTRAQYFTAKKSRFSSADRDVRSETSSGSQCTPGSSMIALLNSLKKRNQRVSSELNNEYNSGSDVLSSRVKEAFNDGELDSPSLKSTIESALRSSMMMYQQSSSMGSQISQSIPLDFQGSSSRNKSSSDSSCQGRKSSSADKKEFSSKWVAEGPSFQNARQFSSTGMFGQLEDAPRPGFSSGDEHRNGRGSRNRTFSGDVHKSSHGSYRSSSRGDDKPHGAFDDGSNQSNNMFQKSRENRRKTSSFTGNIGSHGDPQNPFQSSNSERGSHGSNAMTSEGSQGSYYRGALRGESRGSFRGGRNNANAPYLGPASECSDSQGGSFVGGQGDSNDSYRGISAHRGGPQGPFTSERGYRGVSGGRGISRGQFIRGRGNSGEGLYRGVGGRGGDSRGSFRGGRGSAGNFQTEGNFGRGRAAIPFAGASSDRGGLRSGMRGGRSISSMSSRGGVAGPGRGAGPLRGGSLTRGAPRGLMRGVSSLRSRSETKESRFSAATDLKKTDFIVVDSYKSSNSSLEDFSTLPKEALQCSICKIIYFKSSTAFKEHLESQHHAHMLTLLSARNDSLEQFLKSNAKLASRAIEHEVLTNSGGENKVKEGEFIMCSHCDCTVMPSALSLHNELVQHRELMEFNKPLCCGIKFTKRQAYEVHKVTKKHLSKKHDFEALFITNSILNIEKEALKSKGEEVPEDFVVKSLTLTQSQLVAKILLSLEESALVENDKDNFCLACEVSVPKFRKKLHTCCSDHHVNTVSFCAKNKTRLTSCIIQHLKKLDSSSGAVQEKTTSDSGAVKRGAEGDTAKDKSSAATSSGSQTSSSSKATVKTSYPASGKPSQISAEEELKNKESFLGEDDEENDDEFDYEFSNVDIEDTKEELVENGTSKLAVTKEDEGARDSEEEYIDDDFAYEYDESLVNMDAKYCDKKSDNTRVSPENSGKKEDNALDDEEQEDIDDFEYEYESSIGDKTADKDNNDAKAAAAQPVDQEAEESEDEMDEFDYQFESADEPQEGSFKEVEAPEDDVDDEDFHYEMDDVDAELNETQTGSLEDERSSLRGNHDDEEFDYELADEGKDLAADKGDINGQNSEDNEESDYDVLAPEPEETQIKEEKEEEEVGFDYELPAESPEETKEKEDINEGDENSDNELSTFDYELPNEDHIEEETKGAKQETKGAKQETKGAKQETKGAKQEIKGAKQETKGAKEETKDAEEETEVTLPASDIKSSDTTPGLSDNENDCEATVLFASTVTEEVEEPADKKLDDILETEKSPKPPTDKAEVDVSENHGEASTVAEGNENETKIKPMEEELSPPSSSCIEVAEEKSDEISVSEKEQDNEKEEEIPATSSKRKRAQKASGSDKSAKKNSVPTSPQASTRPKRRSIAPIRFK